VAFAIWVIGSVASMCYAGPEFSAVTVKEYDV
jgi:hypothetical protein